MSTVVNSWNEWDPLKHVIVGRADDCHIPPEEPALDAKVPEDRESGRTLAPMWCAVREIQNAFGKNVRNSGVGEAGGRGRDADPKEQKDDEGEKNERCSRSALAAPCEKRGDGKSREELKSIERDKGREMCVMTNLP